MDCSLSKKERLSSHAAIEKLVTEGKYFSCGGIRCCYRLRRAQKDVPDGGVRIMVSVPKKYFKRAVRRNLIKRRIREAFRLQKQDYAGMDADVMFLYSSKEILPYEIIAKNIGEILKEVYGKSNG